MKHVGGRGSKMAENRSTCFVSVPIVGLAIYLNDVIYLDKTGKLS